MGERRRLFNLVQELRGNIRVYCRVRPTGAHERGPEDSVAVAFPAGEEGVISVLNSKRAVKGFEFDAVFKPGTPNGAVYKEVEGLVLSALDGYNTCIFAYGQTGSGKTFTMEGTAEEPGINFRALGSLFGVAAERAGDGWAFDMSVSMLEIYNEDIRDMLAERGADGLAQGGKLVARESPGGMVVPGLTVERVESAEQVRLRPPQHTHAHTHTHTLITHARPRAPTHTLAIMRPPRPPPTPPQTLAIMHRAYKNRTTFATDMNAHSSRSHALLSVYVRATNKAAGTAMAGKLHLVDLAGCVFNRRAAAPPHAPAPRPRPDSTPTPPSRHAPSVFSVQLGAHLPLGRAG